MANQGELKQRVKRETTKLLMSRSLTIRIPGELYEKLEKLTEKIRAELPGHQPTISDVARGLLEQGVVEGKRKERRAARIEELADQAEAEMRARKSDASES
jgi:predicted transcriptional regulator